MMPNKFATILALIALTTLTGCFYSREVSSTKRDIVRELPELRVDRQMQVSLGPLSMRFATLLSRFANDDEIDVRRYLTEISRVKVGVYDVERSAYVGDSSGRIGSLLEDRGWEPLARVTEGDEAVWVMYKERRNNVKNFFVVALSDEELVIARVKGNLSRIIEKALEDNLDLDLMDVVGD